MSKHDDLSKMLLDLDRAFGKETKAKGAEGWASYFAEDGKMMTKTGPIVGKEKIKSSMAGFFKNKDAYIKWNPEYAEISDGMDMGFTYGEFTRGYINDKGERIFAEGQYVTIWRKQKNGEWKITCDVGTD